VSKLGFDPKADPVKNEPAYKPVDPARPMKLIPSPNKANAAKAAEIAATGETPLDYMMRVMRDKSANHDRRDKMAAAAAPYVHPKLANIEHAGKDGGPVQVKIVGDDAGLL
jgi:hypothetical protein